MRKFIVISLTLLMMSTSAWCCGGMGPTDNNYMFSVFRREMMKHDLFKSRSDAFWESYTNGACKSYQWNKEEIMSLAEKKGDKEMISYLNHLNKYLDICDQLRETWDYPTKQQLQQRQQDLNAMLASSTSYKGTRLKPQWQLLRMRANMVLGKHADNVAFWEKTGKQQPASLYRDMMRNIYAGSLLKVGRRTEACDIFAEDHITILIYK